MKSGLEGRNNPIGLSGWLDIPQSVSMKSGLEGRNNRPAVAVPLGMDLPVSMKSGLEGRNNVAATRRLEARGSRLNEVRPRRPEQSAEQAQGSSGSVVSMKSGLEGRNNTLLYSASHGTLQMSQ